MSRDFESRSATSVCVVRAERQPNGLLITLLTTLDIASGLEAPPQRFSDVTAALAAVAAFLDEANRYGR
jgi:hypothetical protein